MAENYDVIIVGSGAGGGTLAHRLAPSGKRVLILERGDWLPREIENWDAAAVFVDNRYISTDTWHDKDGRAFQPQIHYFVGGATKLYGAALFRMRERDFGELRHHGGISPAWPIDYQTLEPYYTQAEQLYQVHGNRGDDPTEPPASAPYPFPAISHEPRMQQLFDDMTGVGLHPFHAPCGILINEAAKSIDTRFTARSISCGVPPMDRMSRMTQELAQRTQRADLAPDPSLPEATRLWAALQQASGGTWGGCVYDVDAIADAIQRGSTASADPRTPRRS